MTSPWLNIPLAEYEGHMSLPGIGQARMLSDHFAEILAEYSPGSVAVIGCAGGNGLDRIRPETTTRIVTIDINPDYLRVLASRFTHRLPGLEPYVADVEVSLPAVEPVELVYAALLFEYVAPAPTFRNLAVLCRPRGSLVTVVQLPAGSLAPVSPSPYTSLNALAAVMRLIAPEVLVRHAAEAGFVLSSTRQVVLPSGKRFLAQVFSRSPDEHAPQATGVDGATLAVAGA